MTHPAPTIRVGPTTSTFGLYCALCGERLRRAERGIYCDHPRLPYVQDDPQRDVWHLACAAQLSHALAAEVRRAEMPARGPQADAGDIEAAQGIEDSYPAAHDGP